MFLVDLLSDEFEQNNFADFQGAIIMNPDILKSPRLAPKTIAQRVMISSSQSSSSNAKAVGHREQDLRRQYRMELGVEFQAAPEAYARSASHKTAGLQDEMALLSLERGRPFIL